MNNNIRTLPEGKYDLQVIRSEDSVILAEKAKASRDEAISMWTDWYTWAFNNLNADCEIHFRTLNRKTGRVEKFAI